MISEITLRHFLYRDLKYFFPNLFFIILEILSDLHFNLHTYTFYDNLKILVNLHFSVSKSSSVEYTSVV